MTTWWVAFEERASEASLGVTVVDAEDFALSQETCVEFIERLAERGLTPPRARMLWVRVQRLPASANIPAAHKDRLLTDQTLIEQLGGVLVSSHGAN
jgi:hypothetical protein